MPYLQKYLKNHLLKYSFDVILSNGLSRNKFKKNRKKRFRTSGKPVNAEKVKNEIKILKTQRITNNLKGHITENLSYSN